MQDEALCDNSERSPAVNYYHTALHLGCFSPRSASGHTQAGQLSDLTKITFSNEESFAM